MKRENILGDVLVIVSFMASILLAISVIFLLFYLTLLNRDVSLDVSLLLNMIIINI